MKKFKAMLDAGHYGKFNRSPALPSFYESEMTWKLALFWKAELETYKDVEVMLTRADQAKDLNEVLRGRMAEGFDLFSSLHANAPKMDGKTVEEVQGTDYPAVFVSLDGTVDVLGARLAQTIAAVMGTAQRGQVHKAPWGGRPGVEAYAVLRGAQEVGCADRMIIEHSFYTDLRAATWLSDDENLRALAKAEVAVIAEHYGLEKTEEEAPIVEEEDLFDNAPTPCFEEDILWAISEGVLLGNEKGDLMLHRACTREETVAIVRRAVRALLREEKECAPM